MRSPRQTHLRATARQAAARWTTSSRSTSWRSANRLTYSGGDSQLGYQQVTDTPVRFGHIAAKEYVETVFSMKHGNIWANFGYMFVAIVFRVLALLSLRFITHQKR